MTSDKQSSSGGFGLDSQEISEYIWNNLTILKGLEISEADQLQ